MNRPSCHMQYGYSLIEMIIVIAILAIVSTGIYVTFDSGQKEYGSRQSVLWMQQQARLAMMSMEKDLKMIGYGFIDVGTFKLNYYDKATGAQATMNLVNCTDNSGGFQKTDTISFRYYDGPLDLNKDVTITNSYLTSSPLSETPVNTTTDFNDGDYYMIYDPACSDKNASLLQVSGVTSGLSIKHNDGDACPYNPPAGKEIFPGSGYGAGCKVFNLGQDRFKQIRYTVDSNYNLVKETQDDPSKPVVNHIAAQGIEDFQIKYLFKDGAVLDSPVSGDPDHDINNLRALRISIIVRTQKIDRSYNSAATYQLTGISGNGDPHNSAGYRRMDMSTVISLRNMAFRP
jgi:type IV pilus assembly protein PilW